MRRPSGGTLRGRLTAWLVVILLAGSVVTGTATVLALRTFLVDRLDGQLADAGGRLSASLEHGTFAPGGSDSDADNAVPGQSVGTLAVRLVRGGVAQSAVVDAAGHDRPPPLTGTDAHRLAVVPVGGGARTVSLTHLGDYRVEAVAGRDGDVQLTGLPLHEVDETVANLTTIELLLFGAVILTGGVVTAVVVRRTLAPLHRVAETARGVSGLALTDPAALVPTGFSPARPTTEVDHVSVALDQMLGHVRSALHARDETEARLRRFVGDAGHELRTPVATIRAYAEFVERSRDELPEATRTAVDRIDAAAGRMATLVDDLMVLTRLDEGRPVQCAPVDITRIVVEAVVDARAAAPDHEWVLVLPEEPVTVLGDEDRLHQVVVNLVSNARHHTPAGTTVEVGVAETATVVRVVVADDGPGVPGDLGDQVFDRFTRGDPSRTGGHGNSGLGLAIARGIARAHGGDVTLTRTAGRTRFTLTVPAPGPPGAGSTP